MSEDQPKPDDMQGAEFDVQAAQSAKNLLEEAQRADVSSALPTGTIVDKAGTPLRTKADNFRLNNDVMREDEKRYSDKMKELGDEANSLQVAADHLETTRQDWVAGNNLRDDARKLNHEAAKSGDKARYATLNAKANLWDSSQHLRANETEYKAAAIEDANAAGHDISYNGVEYPANPPQAEGEKPPQTPAA